MADPKQVALVDPDGQLFYIPEAEVPTALAKGYKTPDEAQQKEVASREKYGQGVGNELRAGFEGGARGLSFGLSDLALSHFDKEGLRERKERNPWSAGIGEAAGVGAGLLATGGAAGVAGAGVRGAALAGEGVATLAGRGLASLARAGGTELAERSLAQRVLAKGIEKGAGSAVEGALYGGGQAVTEDSLGESDDLGQSLLAHVGLGAAFGGLGGTVLGSLGEVARTGTRGIHGTMGLGGREVEAEAADAAAASPPANAGSPSAVEGEGIPSAPGVAAEGPAAAPGVNPSPPASGAAAVPTEPGGFRHSLAKVASIATGADEEGIGQIIQGGEEGALARQRAFGDPIDREAATARTSDLVNKNEALRQEVTQEALGPMKLDRIKAVVARDEGDAAGVVAQRQFGQANELIGSVRELAAAGKAEPAITNASAAPNKLAKLADEFEARLNKLAKSGGEDANAKAFIALDEFKRRIGPLAKPGRFASTAEDDFVGQIRKLYTEKFQPALEDQAVWGKAGELQKRVNAKWTKYLDNADLFSQKFMTRVGKESFNPRFAADPEKIEGYLHNLTSARNDLKHQLFTSHAENQEALVKEIRDVYDLQGDAASRVEALSKHNAELKGSIKDIEHEVTLRNQTRELLHTKTGKVLKTYAAIEKGLAKRFGKGPLAQAMLRQQGLEGAVNDVAARQAQVGRLAGIERAAYRVNKSISQGIDGFLEGIDKTAQRAVAPASVGAAHRIFIQPKEQNAEDKPLSRHDSYKARLDELAELSQNPQKMQDLMLKATAGWENAAPKTAGQMQLSAIQAVHYLFDKAPKDPLASQRINPSFSKWRPSESQLSSFDRTLQAVQHPLTILDDLKTGTITRESVDAVRTCYPALYQKILAQMMPKLVEQKAIPLRTRVQLSTLFGVSVDAMATPQFFASMQQTHAQNLVAAGPAKPAARSKNMHSDLAATPLQRAQGAT